MPVKRKPKKKTNNQNLWQKVKNWFTDKKERLTEKMEDGTSLNQTWKTFRPVSIVLASALITIIIISCTVGAVNNAFFAPVDSRNDEPVLLVVGSGSSMAAVANKLQKLGLINSKWGIKLLADFTNRSGKVKAGEYVLDRTMSAEEILDLLTQPSPVKLTASVTIIEGMKLEDIAKLLAEKGVITNIDSFITACNTATGLEGYDFMSDLQARQGTRYLLEGYLYPNTYDFYLGSSNAVVINKLLSEFDQVYAGIYKEYKDKADARGLTMNQVITLASIVQSESLQKDFAKVASVFYNRLDTNMVLGSDVCVQYALNKKQLVLSSEDLKVDSPYNMHINKGLPPGPICAPGKAAIKAVLDPDQSVIDGKYLYFTLTDPATGELAFSKTYEEHKAVVDKWRPVWEEYDKNH